MKKIAIFILTFILCMPVVNAVTYKNEKCSYDQIQAKLKQLQNVTVNYTVMPEGSTYTHPVTLEEVDSSNQVKIELTNMPDDFYALIGEGSSSELMVNNMIYKDSGVYKISFKGFGCGTDTIKSFEVFVPFYDASNKKDVWFDGTYEPSASNLTQPKNKVNKTLIVILIVLIVIILGSVAFIIINRRKSKYENQF